MATGERKRLRKKPALLRPPVSSPAYVKRRQDWKKLADKRLLRNVELVNGIKDLLGYWNRQGQHGWTAADVERLAEIRALAEAWEQTTCHL